MQLLNSVPVYHCGHAIPVETFELMDDHAQTLSWSAIKFACPQCCREALATLELNPQVYVNLQQIRPGMAAFVIEVQDVASPLADILALSAYVRRAASSDELHPGGDVFDLSLAVWRKEYWFANETEPMHVVALLRHLKQEMRWLAAYLRGGEQQIHFADFAHPYAE